MAITCWDGLRHSPAARDTKSSSRVIAIIIRSLNNILFLRKSAAGQFKLLNLQRCKLLPKGFGWFICFENFPSTVGWKKIGKRTFS
jgi:hypothetical protein